MLLGNTTGRGSGWAALAPFRITQRTGWGAMDQQQTEAAQVEAVFLAHQRFIERVARLHAPHAQDVPDIVQSVAMKLCRRFRTFKGQSDIRTWLYRVTVNAARDFYAANQMKSERLQASFEEAGRQDQAVHYDDVLIEQDRFAALRAAVERLRHPAKQAILADFAAGTVKRYEGPRFVEARRALASELAGDPRVE